MAINKELLRDLAERIVEHPESFDMGMWFYGAGGEGAGFRVAKARGCGTAACLAGHLCLMDKLEPLSCDMAITPEGDRVHAAYYAKKRLGLDDRQASQLFSTGGWPGKYRRAYVAAIGQKDWAKAACVAAERVKHFVEMDGKEPNE